MNSRLNKNYPQRKPIYQRITAEHRFGEGDEAIGWRIPQTNERGDAVLTPYNGVLSLKDQGVEALNINEGSGGFGGITAPVGVAWSDEGVLLLADPNNSQILGSRGGDKPFKPLWSSARYEPLSHWHLKSPVDLMFSNQRELVVCDAARQEVIWYRWPSKADERLRVKHVERFDSHRPVAVTAAFDEGYFIALNPAQDAGEPSCIVRVDSSFQNTRQLALNNNNMARISALCSLSDDSLLLLHRDPQWQGAKVLRLSGFSLERQSRDWTVQTVEQVDKVAELDLVKANQGALEVKSGQPCIPGTEQPFTGIEVDRQGAVASPGSRSSKLTLVATPRRIRLNKARRLISPAIEGDTDQFSWDRLLIQTSRFGVNTSIEIQSKTADQPLGDEQLLESDYLPWSTPVRIHPDSSPQVLVQSAPGRYLYLSLTLYGDGYNSPDIEAINIEGPRTSALQWLPPVYHQDNQSRHFLDRFLSYFDVVFDEIAFEADHFARYLDPYSVPDPEFLDWLASWFDWQFLPDTDEPTKRRIISELKGYYHQRGTVAGIKQILRWYTGLTAPFPQIIEHFAFRRLHDIEKGRRRVWLGGKEYPLDVSAAAHVFTVLIPDIVAPDERAQARLQKLLEAQKPAHTQCETVFFESRVVVGFQSTIGADMVLSSTRRTESSATLVGRPHDQHRKPHHEQ